jgi:redox-sensitive bicupin YhaK (pirin superfamily)
MHRDSVASEQAIRPGEVNWMTAGSGITHSERFERARAEGGRLDVLQTWVALPKEHEETQPSFSHHGPGDLPAYEGSGLRARLIAGEAFGEKANVILIGAEPVGPRFIEWNFVSSSRERIEQAKANWRAGRMKLPDLDEGEFIALPPDPPPGPNPMS